MDLNNIQLKIIATIKEELSTQKELYVGTPKKYLSSFRTGVYYQPTSGKFLFDDHYVLYEDIIYLIKRKILLFKGFEVHQNEKMVRYELNNL